MNNTPADKDINKEEEPRSITTANGSTYTYLNNGKTQRYKKATETLQEPQDLLVFIPPWDKIAEKAKVMYPDIFVGIENEIQFEQLILAYNQKGSGKTIRPSSNGQEVNSSAEIERDDLVFLNFIDKITKVVDFTLPTSRKPKMNYSTFDTRKYTGEDGNVFREKHIGSKITSIEY